MKHRLAFILLIFGAVLFVGCEKFELEDHCPEEQQDSTSYGDPQDFRVNDDSDSEESGANNKALSADGNLDLSVDSPVFGTDDGSDNSNDDSDDDTINDDSDNEDEGDQPRQPNDNGAQGGGDSDRLK